jgi:hypothetical protein
MKTTRLTIIFFLVFLVSCKSIVSPGFFFWLGNDDSNGKLLYDADVYLFTSESGRIATFDVSLNMKPTGSVRVGPITISKAAEGNLLSNTYLDFDASNWDTAQTIRIQGVDDALSDGNATYQISFGSWNTEDTRFSTQSLPIISVVNTDDETSGVAVSPSTGSITSESGTRAKIYYVLQTRPMRSVTIQNFSSSLTTEATAPNESLVFTYDNWDTPQYIEVTGVDDFTIDGPKVYTISAGLTVSSDPSYNGKSIPVATGTNVDNDSPGFTVVNLNTTTTTEAGGAISFSVVMNNVPLSNVTIASIVANPATEAVAVPSSLTFTSANWNTPQTVTISGVDDLEADGNQTVTIVSSTATSGDGNYNGITGPSFPSITNTDDDTRGINITPSTGFTISENGGNQVYSVTLNSKPPSGKTVTINGISTTNSALVSVAPSTLSFDSTNWNIAQTITATAIDNLIDEDTRSVTLSFGSIDTSSGSRDTGYDSISLPSSVTLSVTDDDTAGFTVTPVSGLTVDENAGPFTTTFTVVLNSQPTGSVSIPTISSSNTSEITVSPSSLSFSTANWNTPQTVTLTSVIDGSLDGNVAVTINLANGSSGDSKYNGLAASSVSATNIDSGAPQVILQNISSALTMVEDGTSTITFEIKLAILPGSTVTIGPILSSDTSEAVILDSSGNPTNNRTLVFNTTTNSAPVFSGDTSTGGWNMAQTITIRSVSDNFADGTIPININIPTATGSFYAGLRPATVISGYTPATGNLAINITDNDTAGFSISSTTINITEGGSNGTFTVTLTSAPCNTPGNLANCTAGSLSIPLSTEVFSAPDFTQYTFSPNSPASLTFDETNWNIAQTVTILPVDDNVDEILTRVHTFTLGAISGSGTDYEGLNPTDVTVNITDNDNASPMVNFALKAGSQAFTAESGLKTTYQISLASQPLSGNSVTITVASADTTEGQVLISTGPDVTANSNNYTFTSANWNTAVDVVIKGLSDADSANITYTITVGSGSETGSSAAWYTGFTGATGNTATLLNYDIGISAITVAVPASMSIAENAAAFSIYVFLQQAPTGSVTIPVSVSTSFPCRLMTSPSNVDQFTVSPASLTITSANWDQAGTHNRITVTPNDDAVNDGNISCPIQVGWDGTATYTSSADGFYNGFDPSDPNLTLNDNDTAGVSSSALTPSPLITSESGAKATFNLTLASQPMANVTVSYTPTPGGIVSFSPANLTFTPSNYATAQTVTITGQDIGTSGDQSYTIAPSVSTLESSTGGTGSKIYDNSLTISSLSAANIELLYDIIPCTTPNTLAACGTSANASGGLVSSPTLNTTEAGGQARFQVRLRARPTAATSINLSSSNTAEGTVSPASLSYTTVTWNTYQDVVVTGIDDLIADGNISFMTVLSSLSSADTGFNGIALQNVSLTNQDNDTASVIITPTSGLITTEGGGQATFTVHLNSEPTALVTIPLTSSDTNEGTISAATVQFDNACPGVNCWSTPKTITITGVDDFSIDGNVSYTIITGSITSTDTTYGAMIGSSISDAAVTNNDND